MVLVHIASVQEIVRLLVVALLMSEALAGEAARASALLDNFVQSAQR
jgi:hypothetical protein